MLEERGEKQEFPVAEAMLAEDVDAIADPLLRNFRRFADIQGEDRHALAALNRAPRTPLDLAGMARLPMPVLVMIGDRDEMVGDPEELARIFPNGRAVVLPGCDHFTAIPHAMAKATVFDFLDDLLDDPFPSPF